MTPPTEFNPTPEQVEEAQKRIVEYWSHMYELPMGTFQDFAYWHLTELHRETEKLRGELEQSKCNAEKLGGALRLANSNTKRRGQTIDALKAQVVAAKVALSYILNHPIDNEALCIFEMQETAKQALTQLEAK